MELSEVAEQPWNWKYLKISLCFLFLHLLKNLVLFLYLPLWLKQSQHISGCKTYSHLPQSSACSSLSQISLSVPMTDKWEGADVQVCIYHGRQLSLLFTCVTSVALPHAGESNTRRKSLVLTEPSAYICILKMHIHCCSCKEVTNYRLVLVSGTVQKNCHCDKEWWALVERSSSFLFSSEILYIFGRYLHVFQSKLSRKSLLFVHHFHRPLNIPKLKIYCKFVRVDMEKKQQ